MQTVGARVRISQELPLPVGTSPFHVKGHVYAKMLEDFAVNVPGGIDAVIARAGDAAIARFASQRFIASSWYDALPMLPLSFAHARLLGVPYHQHLRDRGRYIAERDVPGIYRFLLKLSTPEMVMRRLPRAASQYFDFGPADVAFYGSRHAVTVHSGIPEPLVPFIATTTEGFVAAALEMAGAGRVNVRCVDTEGGPERAGIATFKVRLEATWI
jgi:hypothetical protein